MEIMTCSAGLDAGFSIQLADGNGQPITTYIGTETLAASIWPGDAESIVGTLPVSFASPASDGILILIVPAATTASLEQGDYRVRITLTSGGMTIPVYLAALRIEPSPGTIAAPPTYGTYQDLLNNAPWLGQLQDLETGQAGFGRLRARARTWLEDAIHSHYRGAGGFSSFQPSAGWASFGGRGGPRSPWLVSALASNQLLVTDKVREICAKKTVAYVCESQIGPDADSPYVSLAYRFHAQASSMVLNLTAEIDTDGDGLGDVAITMSAANVLRG